MVYGREQGGPGPQDLWPDGKEQKGEKHETEEAPIDIESRKLDLETRERITDEGIALMREILSAVPDHVVFASTGMYLQGKEKGIDEIVKLPGDFDAAVKSERDLDLVRERLANVPGVQFENDGKYKRFEGEDTKVLAGIIPMTTETPMGEKVIKYEFEFFLNSRIVKEDIFNQSEQMAGLNVLTLEGLQNQYINNLAFETKIEKASTEVVEHLIDQAREPFLRNELDSWAATEAKDDFVPSQELIDLTHQIRLGPDQLIEFYKAVDEYRDQHADEDPETATSKMAIILAGQKTKVEKRTRNIQELDKIRNPGRYDDQSNQKAA